MASTVDEPAAVPGATVGAAVSSEAEAGVADVAPGSGAEEPVVPEEKTTLLEASEGMVGHAVRPPSPLVVPLAAKEEDEVEEIEHVES